MKSSFHDQAKMLADKINQYKEEKLIILFHSFGTYITQTMFHHFKEIKDRVIGMIDLGGAPVRFPKGLFENVIRCRTTNMSREDLLKMGDQIHEKSNENLKKQRQESLQIKDPKKRKSTFLPFENKYQTISLLHMMSSAEFEIMFSLIRNEQPNILKLVIYGDNDTIFVPQLLHEKAVFFSYVNELPETQKQFYRNKMIEMYGEQIKGQSL